MQLRSILTSCFAIILLAAMAISTKVVVIGSSEDVQENVFSPEKFGETEFPKVKVYVENRAVDAKELIAAVLEDKKAAGKKYGTTAGIGFVIPVKFSGTVTEGKSGIYYVDVEGMPEKYRIRVQTGPAINGTDLRDASGEIKFGQFTNQIEFQNAGSALNKAMKKQILDKIDNKNLTGKTISIVGVFKLINPKNWLVTPVEMDVK